MNLRDKAVKIAVGGSLNVKRAPANVIDSLIVKEKSHISVLQKGVSWENTVVGFNNKSGDLGKWVDSETQLGFLAIINRQTLQKKRTKTRSSASTNSVENKEPLKTSAVISKLPDAVQAQVNNLLANWNK